jgi:hypothetical protein
MPVLQKGVAALTNRMPKVISPKAHAVIDYVNIGTFGLLAYLFWKHNKRAAIAATTCGVAELTTTLLTDFPGGVAPLMSFPTHGRIDMGLAATCASLPNLMGFDDEAEAKWFRMLGLSLTVVTGMTDFSQQRRGRLRRAA